MHQLIKTIQQSPKFVGNTSNAKHAINYSCFCSKLSETEGVHLAQTTLYCASEAYKILDIRAQSELEIWYCSSNLMKDINRFIREKDEVTDVVSLEYTFNRTQDEFLYGELFINLDYCLATKNVTKEFSVYVVHGILHLLGLDHAKSETDRVYMRETENRILGNLGVAGLLDRK